MSVQTLPPESDAPPIASFDLVEAPWIPVVRGNGTVADVSLGELFETAPSIARLASPFAPERVALTRILAAVLQSSLPGPLTDGMHRELFGVHQQVAPVTVAYLDQWHDRFDLFHPERPFMQLPVDPATKQNTIAALRLDWASGNNVTLFDHHTDGQPPALTPAESIRALLTTLLYQPGGGVSKPFNRTDSPGSKAVMAIVEGEDLWETLVANCWAVPKGDHARPAWERDFDQDPRPVPTGTTPLGHLDRITWRSRAIRLVPSEDGLVRAAFVQQHYKLQDSSLRDPFVPLRFDEKAAEEKVLRVSASRRLWQQSDALLRGLSHRKGEVAETVVSRAAAIMDNLEPRRRPQVLFSGLRIDQAKVGDAQSATLPVSDALLRDPTRLGFVTEAIELADQGAYAIRKGVEVFAKHLGRPADSAFAAQWQQSFWASIGGRFPQFVEELAALDPDHVPQRDGPTVMAWIALVDRASVAGLSTFLAGQGDAPRVARAGAEAKAAARFIRLKAGLVSPALEVTPNDSEERSS